MDLLRLRGHLDKFLPAYVIVFMFFGFYIGTHINTKNYQSILKVLNQIVVISMIYPMMINLRIESLKKASKSWKQLSIAWVMGLIYAPLLMNWLAIISNVDKQIALGLLLAIVVPCSSMSIAYTGLTEGNLELATIIVASSFTLAILTVPGWLSLFASQYNVQMPVWLLIQTIIIVIFIPLIFGYITRVSLIKKVGVEKFERMKHLFPSVSLMGMYAIVFLIFMEKANLIVKKPNMVITSLIPLTLYYAITLTLFTFTSKKMRIPYEDHMAMTFTSTGKNEGTAMAIAIAAGMGLTAIPPAITPLLQIPFLVGYAKLWKRVKSFIEKEIK